MIPGVSQFAVCAAGEPPGRPCVPAKCQELCHFSGTRVIAPLCTLVCSLPTRIRSLLPECTRVCTMTILDLQLALVAARGSHERAVEFA